MRRFRPLFVATTVPAPTSSPVAARSVAGRVLDRVPDRPVAGARLTRADALVDTVAKQRSPRPCHRRRTSHAAYRPQRRSR